MLFLELNFLFSHLLHTFVPFYHSPSNIKLIISSHLTPHTSHLTPHTSLLTPHSSLLTACSYHYLPHFFYSKTLESCDTVLLSMVLLPTGILSPSAQNKTSSCHLSVSEAHGHGSMAESEKQSKPVSSDSPFPLLANKVRCCRICLDDDPHSLYSPCRCRGSIKFVHSHCLTRW